MQKLNPFKIYFLAIYSLIIPKAIKRKFLFKTSPTERFAIHTVKIKIKYWRHFIRKEKLPRKLHFTNQYKANK